MIVVSEILPFRLPLLAFVIVTVWCFVGDSVVAQVVPPIVTPTVTPAPVVVDPIDTGTGFGNNGVANGGGTTGGGATGGADGELDTVEPIRIGRESEDFRNQGFVGGTAAQIANDGFVGPATTNNALGGLGEDRFVGGGVNSGLGQRTATTTSSDLQDNGFSVVRRGMRSKLVSSFAAPQTPGWVTESRFQSHILRQPVVQNMGAGVTMTVQNRRAILRGTVSSEAERDIIKRQLRLEPGIYGIDDQTSISN